MQKINQPKHQSSSCHWFYINHGHCAHLCAISFLSSQWLMESANLWDDWWLKTSKLLLRLCGDDRVTHVTLEWTAPAFCFLAAPVQRLTWMTRGSAERVWSGGVCSLSPAFCLSLTFTKPKRSHSHTAIGSVPGLVKEDVAWLWVFGNVRRQPVELFYRLGIYFLHKKKDRSNLLCEHLFNVVDVKG